MQTLTKTLSVAVLCIISELAETDSGLEDQYKVYVLMASCCDSLL